MVGEYGVNGCILNRYVMGPGTDDEPLTWYSGAGTSSRAWYAADNAGSVIATAGRGWQSRAQRPARGRTFAGLSVACLRLSSSAAAMARATALAASAGP